MRVEVAKTAGFCPGVRRAVEMVESAAKTGKPTVTYGPIIHNHHVVERFAGMGVHEIGHWTEAQPGTTVIIRSHGVSREVYEGLEAQGAIIEDATCPFVKRIHTIVSDAEQRGRTCLIIGVKSHPEVVAIAGWCRDPHVFENPESLEAWLLEEPKRKNLPLIIVSQTTSTEKLWNNCTKIIKKLCTNCEIFDTICSATEKRQSEAAQLAKRCESMIVIGDRNSSNTKRLKEICLESCKDTYLIDSGDDVAADYFGKTSVGITAGASTPEWIIKEVFNIMSEEIKNEIVEESFDQLLEQYDKSLNTGDKVTGIVTGITATEVAVDLGTKHAGYIPYSEISDDPTVKAEDLFSVGQEIEVFVIRVNDAEGTVMLSKKKLDAQKNWDDIEAACENKTVVEGYITEQNKGGVVANVKGIRVFIPASQTGIPKNGDMGTLVKTNVQLKVTEVNRQRKRVVGSIRAVASEARKAAAEAIWAEIEVGKTYQGVVKSLTSYGAFVDIGGVDGMVHVSELSWSRIKNPAEVVSVGDQIEVYVISFDPEKRKISLGYKTDATNPWTIFTNNYKIGDVATVKIVKLMTFGAFAEIIPGIDGLIHISQIADRRIGKPEDVLTEGETVDVKIIDIDTEKKRISLSIRALLEEGAAEEEEAE
ncbi:MAG: bifunctional 4-hydroxy-3-methylbut-2-enyl diphosphate reductase/30S ribosomal protein S1 [Oscillospiraceae bacterium]|nr:bifunctional 4-hydroxy-3-methylbut-2-enyl diphosphate reductase/30S ribosomal protein S1 [Oscillospiraceae bacterium]